MKTSDKKKIKQAIITGLNLYDPGRVYYGASLVSYVNSKLNLNKYPDTILHYMRELKDEGKINFESIGSRSESKYRKLANK
jgi:hypothetical protein